MHIKSEITIDKILVLNNTVFHILFMLVTLIAQVNNKVIDLSNILCYKLLEPFSINILIYSIGGSN